MHAPVTDRAAYRTAVCALGGALDRRALAEVAIDLILHRDFPAGTPIVFDDYGKRRNAVVTMNCYGDRIKVRNVDTGKERFIRAARIVSP